MKLLEFNLLGGFIFLPALLLMSSNIFMMFLGVIYFGALVFATYKIRGLRIFFKSWLHEVEKYERNLLR